MVFDPHTLVTTDEELRALFTTFANRRVRFTEASLADSALDRYPHGRSLTPAFGRIVPAVPQVPTFRVNGEFISPSPRDGERLVAALREAGEPDADAAATKIEAAMELGSSTQIDLKVGEDDAVLRALEDLQGTGDFLKALVRLERALRGKIEREGG